MRGRTFQNKGIVCAKVLNLERAWHAPGTEGKPGHTTQFVHPSFSHLRLSLPPFVVVVISSSRAGTSDFFPAVSLTSVMVLGTELTFIRCLKKHLSACCVLNHCQYLLGKDLIFPLPSDKSKLDAVSCIR